MPSRLTSTLRGLLSLSLYCLNTLFWGTLLLLLTLLKLLVPFKGWRRLCSRLLNGCATNWVGVNKFIQRLLSGTNWDVQGATNLQKNGWYLVISNHQSWVDILVLQNVLHRKIPFLKFFQKKELMWIPILGQCWWALDFPFMKRYSKQFLKKHPHLKGKDFETTQKACAKFKTMPVSVMNFVEGTRFTPVKHSRQKSPFTHLLKTRAGGVAFVLNTMGPQIHRILDVTIVYPKGVKSFWAFLCGRIEQITVRVNAIPVTAELIGDYAEDRQFRVHFHNWLNQLWSDKDQRIEDLLNRPLKDSAPEPEMQIPKGAVYLEE